jgi:galactitol-specific phosphotransferase system IIB component
MLKSREELEENIVTVLQESKLKTKKKVVNDIKKHLATYDIIDTQSWINDPEENLKELSVSELLLFTQQVFAKTGDLRINVEDFFTQAELSDANQYSASIERMQNQLEFPITLSNVTVVGNGAYMATVDIQTIDKLLSNGLLDYNYDLQREATYRRN